MIPELPFGAESEALLTPVLRSPGWVEDHYSGLRSMRITSVQPWEGFACTQK